MHWLLHFFLNRGEIFRDLVFFGLPCFGVLCAAILRRRLQRNRRIRLTPGRTQADGGLGLRLPPSPSGSAFFGCCLFLIPRSTMSSATCWRVTRSPTAGSPILPTPCGSSSTPFMSTSTLLTCRSIRRAGHGARLGPASRQSLDWRAAQRRRDVRRILWMLQGWLPPRWALVGGVLAMFKVAHFHLLDEQLSGRIRGRDRRRSRGWRFAAHSSLAGNRGTR